ncbi:hypothetical protein L3X38_016811 [Prunus dulcis]|uniref:Uncharacterized protein n=1 Tax=Prunus dulcis TaxID=3755 RepID=A0AAD4Z974_PRUDU|nr:hypothetical protein L3X38_016811 [Prunus dulcis]
MVVKLDLEKTYDVLDWSFLKTYLLMFDFSIDWCPREVSKQMNSTCKNIFSGSQTKTHHVYWKDICIPKEMGGLGVRNNYAVVGFVIRYSGSHVLLDGAKNIGDVSITRGTPRLLSTISLRRLNPFGVLNF